MRHEPGHIVPIIRKEFRQIRRDPRTMGILLFVPVFMLMMFGYALNFDVKHTPVAVLDLDRTPASRELWQQFGRTEFFDLRYWLRDQREIDRLLGTERARLAVVIPPGFGAGLAAGRSPSVQFIVDGANSNAATSVLGSLEAMMQQYSLRLTAERIMRRGGSRVTLPLDYRPRVWFNPELKSARFLIPGLIGFILMVVAVISTTLSIVREKERGTMEQLAVSPVTPLELVVGKTAPYVLIALLSTTMILLLGAWLFEVRVAGSLLLLYGVTLVFILAALGMGIMISTLADTQQVAFMIAVIATMLPSYILSGFVFPIRNMPLPVQLITYLVPGRYYLVCIRAIILKGAGLEAFWPQVLALCAFAAAMLGAAAVRIRMKKL
ncbi:MAG: ABC transporter permease [Candidatus Edwardsbacteria bacterium]|jgi:ABC-2 type transport system permease protein|nr:ABC transporter permease [Candidatus Edwardsbacteria bacterium]